MECEDDLCCKVCLGFYDEKDLKPRILPCLHSVCQSCLQMVLEMSKNERKHHNDVIVLKCPICRTTQPLHDNDVTSFPVNKKILERLSSTSRMSNNNQLDSTEEVTEKFRALSIQPNNHQIEPTAGFSGRNDHGFMPDHSVIYEDFDDAAYLDDVITQLQIAQGSENNSFGQAHGEVTTGNNLNCVENEEDDVMASIRRSCAEMYGDPDEADSDSDQVADETGRDKSATAKPGRSVVAAKDDLDGQKVFKATLQGHKEGCGTFRRTFVNNNKHRNRFYQRHKPGVYEEMNYTNIPTDTWVDNRLKTGRNKYESEEEIMMEQLQNEAISSPDAADVLQEIVQAKSQRDAERNRPVFHGNNYGRDNVHERNMGFVVDRSDRRNMSREAGFGSAAGYPAGQNNDIVQMLRRQAHTNPEAAVIVRDMELAERWRSEEQIGQAQNERTFQQGSRGVHSKFNDPNSLVEEILKDRNTSPEDKNRFISDMAAQASKRFDQDDTLSTLMQQAKENPLAAQILHEVLSRSNNY